MEKQDADLIVVGAGISGISAATFYLDTHPQAKVIILEQDGCPGGVWGASRAFEGFWSQTGMGLSQFMDRPVVLPADAKLIYQLPEAKHLTQYIEDYVDNHEWEGVTLRQRMHFGCDVQKIVKTEGLWHVEGTFDDKQSQIFRAPKIMMAGGLYSIPNMPDLPSREAFNGKVIHHKDFGKSAILSSPDIKRVVILGGAKSAGDMAYMCVKAGKQVSWIVRESGAGPASFTEPKGMGRYANAPELGSTRITQVLSPSIFAPHSWLVSFFHTTAIGRSLTSRVWSVTNQKVLDLGNFRGREGARKGFEQMESNPNFFWLNGYFGMAQQPDFWSTIAENVDVHRSDIESLGFDSVKLQNGASVLADAIICGTGWQKSFTPFVSPSAAELDIPHPPEKGSQELRDVWEQLEKEADAKLVARFPGIANPPRSRPSPQTPFRLWNLMAPLADDSVVFLGYVGWLNAWYGAACQAIWATAYLDKNIVSPTDDEKRKEIANVTAFSKRRYPFMGQEGNAVNFDMVGYCDHLLKQVGLSSHIQKGWLDWWFGVNTPNLLVGMKDEYLQKFGIQQ